MAHFAKLDSNNIVIFVTVGRQEDDGKEAELTSRTGDVYKQTSYNTRGGVHYQADGTPSADQSKAFRKNYAGLGYTYDAQRDAFIPPKPYASWLLNEDTCLWESPVPYPTDIGTPEAPKRYTWDEATTAWVLVEEATA
jgi:hypothetical protein